MGRENNKIGAVAVIGGGVGGMQASLDLAESGFKVYLIDRESSIGGTMAKLDKTFPTNDCSMCIVSPRLVEAGRHLNIETITCADVVSLEGEAGNFNLKLIKRARFIDPDKCTGCGECARVCPIEVPNLFEMGLNKRKAIYRNYPQAVPSSFAVEKLGLSPCKTGCPADTSAHGYIALTAQGRFEEALEVARMTNPFVAICGRVCTHPCEKECRRGEVDEPIAIAWIKRFLADYEMKKGPIPPPKIEKLPPDQKVAIIGAGPGGLACANVLARRGYHITVFEKLPVPGGMMFTCIPAYRLPRNIIETEIKAIQDLGVVIKTNMEWGKDFTLEDLKKQGFKAIYIGIGAYKGLKLGVPGEDEFEGFYDAIKFLTDVAFGKVEKPGRKLCVIGGGNSAIDAARTAIRLGVEEVHIVYRRTRKEMPASPHEVEAALAEGVILDYLTAPVRILGKDGKVVGMECIKMQLGEPDASGRRRPIPVEGSNFVIETDCIVPAISQEPDLSCLNKDEGFNISKWNTFVVDELTQETNIPGVFAGGDCVTGPLSVISAIAQGNRAAESIDRYIKGLDLKEGREKPKIEVAPLHINLNEVEPQPRAKMPEIPAQERIKNFEEVELGFTEEQVIKEANRCLGCGICCECYACVRACQAGAIDHNMDQTTELDLNVGAVILAPGFELFDAKKRKEYGFERFANVITSLEFERILSASGPFMGQILRLSDQKHPHKIAFIQCFGSRDMERNYCSSVCCMYATKQAIIAKEHQSDLECHIFYIDLRAFGKGFDEYYERAKQLGVKYTRCLPSTIKEDPITKNLLIQYMDENKKVKWEEFDMVVLSAGLCPPKGASELAKAVGIELNQYGFCLTSHFSPTETTRKGVFVCGPFAEPKDIPETVVQASGAAAQSQSLLAEARGTMVRSKEYPPERDVSDQSPRIGVILCHCGRNIGGVLNMKELLEYSKTLPNVVYAEDKLYSCSQDAQVELKEKILEHNLNRVVVAACTPRTHEPLFQESLREVGLNPYLFEFASIREHCSWVHMSIPDEATKKAKILIRMAVAKANLLKPLHKFALQLNKEVLVIGGGIAGMTCALNLARQGFIVNLVERSSELGGLLKKVHQTIEGEDPQKFLQELMAEVKKESRIKIFLNSTVSKFSGFVGNFKAVIASPGKQEEVSIGAVIVATGGVEYKGPEYLYGKSDKVLTQLEFENRIHTAPQSLKEAKEIVMIQCVGSRTKERPYCSRVCCTEAIKNALAMKKINPHCNIFILYRDIRTYGFREQYYRQAREEGIYFIRYDENMKPEVFEENGLKVKMKEQIVGLDLEFKPDLLVLSMATVPPEGVDELSALLKVPLTQDKLFLEAHMKLRPVDFSSEGLFLCGLAHYPKFADETIAQANAAAGRASTILSKDFLKVGGAIAVVDANKCAACLTCVRVCPYDVPRFEDGVIVIDPALCQGCGTCAGECSAKAIQLMHSTDEQILAKTEAFAISKL